MLTISRPLAPIRKPLQAQAGMMLLEGLLAILIFSIGVLAIVGLQSVATKQVTDARYRTEASVLVEQLLGEMWATGERSVSALRARFGSDAQDVEDAGDGYQTWLAEVERVLPGVVDTPVNYPSVHVDDQGTVTVAVYWRAPTDPEEIVRRQHVVVTRIVAQALP